jgi:hypothetical protein
MEQKQIMRNHPKLLIMLGLLMILAACTSTNRPLAGETPAVPEATAITPETSPEAPGLPDSGTVTNEADVETVKVLVMESMPVQVVVEISGDLPNDCITIEDVVTVRDGDTVNVTITT